MDVKYSSWNNRSQYITIIFKSVCQIVTFVDLLHKSIALIPIHSSSGLCSDILRGSGPNQKRGTKGEGVLVNTNEQIYTTSQTFLEICNVF